MSEETEKTSGDQSKGKESNTLDQNDISKLIDKMQGEENSSEAEDQSEKTTEDVTKHESDETKEDESESEESSTLNQDDISKLIDKMKGEENSSGAEDPAEKTTDNEIKQESDKTKDDESESEESSTLNQDDISKLIDEAQSEEKSSEAGERKETTKNVEKDNEGEKNDEPEMPEDENTQTAESNDGNVKEEEIEEKAESEEKDEKPVGEDKKPEKKTDEKDKKKEYDEEDNGSFKGLDFDDESEIDSNSDTEPDIEKDESNNDDKIKKNDEDRDKKSEKHDVGGQAVILKETKKRFKGNRFKLLISYILCVAFIIVLCGAYVFFKKSRDEIIKAEKPFKPEQIAKPENKYSEEQNKQQIKVYETKDILLSDGIIAKLEEITKLRNELLIKEGKFADLIMNYKNGIGEMEDQILGVKQNNQINSFGAAIKNKEIEFGMMTIQRRLVYIEKIEQPYKWLNQGIEELVYLKRKIEIDARISRVISGIDMDKMMQEVDIVIQSYRNGIGKLEIDMKNVELISLEMIWKRIMDKGKFTAENNTKTDEPLGINKSVLRNEKTNDRIIWEEICSGNFKRKNEMIKLSTKAAKCLSKWKHADLFLNGLSELSPNVARYLLKWQGNWICLNGVKKLSPEAAKNLFQWHGNWISLNGISEVSSGLLRYLPHWQGKQLELMGLKYKKTKSERIGLKALAKWEKSGGKLYIPVQIRKVVNKL